jgi:hypothetical protein
VVFDDIDFVSRPYTATLAYAQAKTANALFAVGIARRWAADGIRADAATPGIVAGTRLSRHRDPEQERVFRAAHSIPADLQKTVQQGAATIVLAAVTPPSEAGARYLEDCTEALVRDGSEPAFTGVASYALDHSAAEALWERSLEYLTTSSVDVTVPRVSKGVR